MRGPVSSTPRSLLHTGIYELSFTRILQVKKQMYREVKYLPRASHIANKR